MTAPSSRHRTIVSATDGYDHPTLEQEIHLIAFLSMTT
jgi:hypothetical protein